MWAQATLTDDILKAQKLSTAGNLREALQTLERGIRTTPSEATVLAVALNEAGNLHLSLGDIREAINLLQRAVHLSQQEHGQESVQTTAPLTNLARAWAAQGKFEKAQTVLEQVLRIRRATLEETDPAVSNTLSHLANVYLSRERPDKAESCARMVVRNLESKPALRPLVIASAYNVLALLEFRSGSLGDAERDIYRAVNAIRDYAGADHPAILPYLLNLASIRLRLKQWSDAEAAIDHSLLLAERTLGGDHPLCAEALLLRAWLYRETGRRIEQKDATRRAREILAAHSIRQDSIVSLDELNRGRSPRDRSR